MATKTVSNEGIYNLLTAMCEQAHEDLQPKRYSVNLTNKKNYQAAMCRYREDKANAESAAEWLLYMKDVFVN